MRQIVKSLMVTTAAVVVLLSAADSAEAMTKKKRMCDDIKASLTGTMNGNYDAMHGHLEGERTALTGIVSDYNSGTYSCEYNPQQAAHDAINVAHDALNEYPSTIFNLMAANDAALNEAQAEASANGCTNIDFGWLAQQNVEKYQQFLDAVSAAYWEAWNSVSSTEPPACEESPSAPISGVTAGPADNTVGATDGSGAVNLR
jgi:hypothetical protein